MPKETNQALRNWDYGDSQPILVSSPSRQRLRQMGRPNVKSIDIEVIHTYRGATRIHAATMPGVLEGTVGGR